MEGAGYGSSSRIDRSLRIRADTGQQCNKRLVRKDDDATKTPIAEELKELTMISVVVPIYNEEDLIVQFHEAVAGALSALSRNGKRCM